MTVALGIIGLLALICFAAFLAASETALLRVSRIRVRYLMEKKVKKSEELDRLIADTDFFLPPLLLMVLIVQVTSASLATYLATKISGSAGVGVLAGTATVTILMFVFGELVPKAAAAHD